MAGPSPFDRLRTLTGLIAPADGLEQIPLHLGESRLAPAALDLSPLADAGGWSRYPPPGGTPELRSAYAGWLGRRFGAGRELAAGRVVIEPTAGTKHGVTLAIALATARSRARHRGTPAVILPDPGYPTYQAAADAAGTRTEFYTVDDALNAAPVAAAVESAAGRVAAIVVCNPGNPGGEILPPETVADLAALAVAADAMLIVDECYTDLWLDRGQTPAGYLSLVASGAMTPGMFVVLHTLSKRSGMPGLRSGFAVGDPETMRAFAARNRSCGVSASYAVNTIAAGLWADEDHVATNRMRLVRNWALAGEFLADVPGYRRASAGFFVWLPVPDDEEVAMRLWRDQALLVMPGRYLAADRPGVRNAGVGHVRIALVHEEARMRAALTRLASSLTRPGPHALVPVAPP